MNELHTMHAIMQKQLQTSCALQSVRLIQYLRYAQTFDALFQILTFTWIRENGTRAGAKSAK
jgi:hypothetical protein